MPGWALEPAPNPSVLRLHTRVELTSRTIETCPPATPPAPLGALLGISGVRSLDLHRYRGRLNLRPEASLSEVSSSSEQALRRAWGEPWALPPEAPPRGFEVAYRGPRVVAESQEMAEDQPILRAVFAVRGVTEAVLGRGMVLVRLGRLFTWDERDAEVRWALASVR